MSSSCSRASLSNLALAGICSSTTTKPGCGPDLCNGIGHAVVQRVEVLAEVRREGELLAIRSSTSCLVWASARFAYRKCWPAAGRLLQVVHAEGANRLHDVGSHAEGMVTFLRGLIVVISYQNVAAPLIRRRSWHDPPKARVVVCRVPAGSGARAARLRRRCAWHHDHANRASTVYSR